MWGFAPELPFKEKKTPLCGVEKRLRQNNHCKNGRRKYRDNLWILQKKGGVFVFFMELAWSFEIYCLSLRPIKKNFNYATYFVYRHCQGHTYLVARTPSSHLDFGDLRQGPQ